jgi:hypothetical protein
MRAALLGLLVLAPAAIAAPTPHAKALGNGPVSKSPPACGAKILPLVLGNKWTYESVAAPQAAIEAIAKIAPPTPKTFTVEVKKVDVQKSGDTVVTLEETITYNIEKNSDKPMKPDNRVIASTITCNSKGKFEISPDSFFFAGEPGGFLGLTLDDIKRSRDTSLKLTNGGIGENDWREDIVAHFVHTPTQGVDVKLPAGKVELERKFTPAQPEAVSTKMGGYNAEKIGLTTTGRVTLDAPNAPDAKPMELPAGWTNVLWMASGVGVVQSLNAYAHEYQLVDAQLK